MRAPAIPFRPVARLAEGGMGYIELAVRHEGRFQRLYAIKRLHKQLRDDAVFLAMFMDEGRLAGLLRHPNVVSVLDVGSDADGPYLVMDFVEGVSAAAIITKASARGARLPLQFCLAVGAQIARGLHAAHELRGPEGELRLVHRDVTPQNVLVGFDGVVKVTDFGIARAFGNVNRTSTGLLKGNVGYMSPEQLRFHEPDRRSDLFSCGIVLYELLAGRRLYREDEPAATARRILEEAPPDVGEVRNDVVPELTSLMFRLLAKDPADRPATALEVAQQLEKLARAFEAEAGPFDVAAYMNEELAAERERLARTVGAALAAPAPVRRGPRRWAMVGAVAVVVGAGAVWQLARSGPASRAAAEVMAAGGWHTCAVQRGRLYCWGKNNEGQLGKGTALNSTIRTEVPGLRDVVSVGAGAYHTCAVERSGAVWCWGRNEERQLGAAAPARALRPERLAAISDGAQVAAGEAHTCLLRASGRVICWGDDRWAQLGGAGPARAGEPVEVGGVADATQIAAGSATTCARRATGAVVCWGKNDFGQAGSGEKTRTSPPGPVGGIADATRVAVGQTSACAVRASGGLVCWGDNYDGQLARPIDGVHHPVPVAVEGIPPLRDVALLGVAGCALARDGGVLCWGRGDWGNLGDGTVSAGAVLRRPRPTRVHGLTGVQAIAAGGIHVCARRSGGDVACWGDNDNGQLGDGTHERRPVPVSVTGLP